MNSINKMPWMKLLKLTWAGLNHDAVRLHQRRDRVDDQHHDFDGEQHFLQICRDFHADVADPGHDDDPDDAD
jgi:hypothetical protein